MSAESKSKRGISGAKNGRSIPFRYHGGNVDNPSFNFSKVARNVPPRSHGGSRNARGWMGGLLFDKLGYFMPEVGQRLATVAAQALTVSPTVDSTIDNLLED